MPLQSDKDRIAAIQDMIAKLSGYRDADRDRDMREVYRVAIDRLASLVHHLNEREPPRVIMPAPRPKPEPEPPVGAIVRAKKPRRR